MKVITAFTLLTAALIGALSANGAFQRADHRLRAAILCLLICIFLLAVGLVALP